MVADLCAESFARKRQLRRHMLLHLVKTTHSSQSVDLAQQEESVRADDQAFIGSDLKDCLENDASKSETSTENVCSKSVLSSGEVTVSNTVYFSQEPHF